MRNERTTVAVNTGSDGGSSTDERQARCRMAADLADCFRALRANYLVQCGLTRKAAQVLHSTTQIANLRTEAAQVTMLLFLSVGVFPLSSGVNSFDGMRQLFADELNECSFGG